MEKQRNAEHRALVLDAVPSGASLALRTHRSTTALDYLADTAEKSRTRAAEEKVAAGEAGRAAKVSRAEDLLLAKVAEQPGIAQGALLKSAKGNQIGTDILESVLADLIASGRVREEVIGEGDRAPHKHFPEVQR